MNIKQIDSKKILISLCEKDLKDFSLPFEQLNLKNEHSKNIIKRLVSVACDNTSFCEIKDKNLLVEAVPHSSGCYLLITLLDEKRKRKAYKIKKTSKYLCFGFENAETFLTAIEKAALHSRYFTKNYAYSYKNYYFIIFEHPTLSISVRHILYEYAKLTTKNRVFVSRIKENGKLLSASNAISLIFGALKKH